MADEKRIRITPALIDEWRAQPGGMTAKQMRMIGKSISDNVNAYLAAKARKGCTNAMRPYDSMADHESIGVIPRAHGAGKAQPGGMTAEQIRIIGNSFAANATAWLQREKAERERITGTPSDVQSEAPRSDRD